MKRFVQIRKITACLSVVLALCMGTGTVAEAGTAYELYELVEGTPSESGYIPTYDPVEDLSGESVISVEEDMIDTPTAFSAEEISEDITIGSDAADVFDDGECFDSSTGSDSADVFDDGSFIDGGTADIADVFSEDPEEPEKLDTEEEESGMALFSDEEAKPETVLRESGLPVRYSLLDTNGATAVKNQQNLGTCWAFSSLESIETGLIKKGLADSSLSLSETHLAYCAFHGRNSDTSDPTANETFLPINNSRWTRIGGNRYYSIATLSRGYGPVYDSDYPLSLSFQADVSDAGGSDVSILDSIITDQAKKSSVSRLKNCYWLFEVNTVTGTARTSRINDIKKFIMNYGAVEIGLYTNSYSYPYDAETNSFYSPAATTPNHSVTLIGWDDEKVTAASSPGAFLMQNSWGSARGENGLFWVSYNDRSIKAPSFYEMENIPLGTEQNEIIHQYDGTGYGSVIKPASPSDTLRISGANVFTSDTAQYLKEVSFYAAAAPISYTISIYRYVKSSPDTGILVHTQSGNNSYAGYYTVDLTKNIPIAKGEKFAVQLQFNHSNGYVPHEKVSNRAYEALPGQSYLYNGTKWVDMTDLDYNCNICIKAIGTKTNDKISMAPDKPSLKSVKVTNYTGITAVLNPVKDKADGCTYVLGTSSTFLKTKKYKKVIRTTVNNKGVFSSLAKGTYYVAVHTYRLNASGQKIYSKWSDVVKIRVTVGRPTTRKLSSAKVTNGNRITVKTASSGEKVSGYDYAMGKTSTFIKNGKYYKTVKNTKKTYAVFAYIPKGTYYMAVRAYNLTPAGKKICGTWSKVVKVTVSGITPGTPKLKSVRTGKGTLKATYTKASKAYRYQYVLTKTAFSATTLSPVSRYKLYSGRKYGSISLKNLKKGTYYFGVRAYTLKGNTKVYGKWVIKKVTIR